MGDNLIEKINKDNLIGVIKGEIKTDYGKRNLVFGGQAVANESPFCLRVLKRLYEHYNHNISEINMTFEETLSSDFEEKVFIKEKANLTLVISNIDDLAEGFENVSSVEIQSVIIKRFVRLIELAHKNRARIIFTTIPPFNTRNKDLEERRIKINNWIKNSTFLDGYLDLDKIVLNKLNEENNYTEIIYNRELEEYMAEKISLDYILERLKPFALDHMSQRDLIISMNKNKRIIKEDGVDILVKPIPDPIEGTRIDRRIKYFAEYKRPKTSGNPYKFHGEPVGDMRDNMGLLNLNLCKENILVNEEKINSVNCRIYKKDGLVDYAPCIIYIHGGAFIGGSLDVSENPCKLLAEKINGVVISIDYSLAPENPYPLGLNDCRKVTEYIMLENTKYGIDKNKIGIVGESAGANLATIIANENLNIKFQGLLYPVVTLSEKNPYFTWNIDLYENPYNEEKINNFINSLKNCEELFKKVYLQGKVNSEREDVSPIFNKNLSNIKKTLIAVSEYDYLRIQGETYGKLIKKSGIDTKIIRYEGVNHAFIDNIGIYPQGEDVINEIAKEFLMTVDNRLI